MALFAAAILLSVTAIHVQQTSGQTCPVTQPTISTSVRCQSPTDITVNYTCNHADIVIIWASTILGGTGEITVSTGSANNPDVPLDSGITGVMAAEMHTTGSGCINSTLTITGNNLISLDGKSLTCRQGGNSHTVNISISIPDLPVLMDIPSTTCGSNGTHEVTLQWTPPTNTGGQVIDRYLVTVSGPAGYICPTDQCNVTTTSTTLTGLECGSTYLVSVSAVNCIGEGNSTQPMMVTATPDLDPPQVTLTSYTDNTLRVEWMSSTPSPCYSISGYSIVVSDSSGVIHQNDSISGAQLIVSELTAQGYLNISLVTVTDCANSSANTTMLRVIPPSPSPTLGLTCPSNCASCSSPSCCRTCSNGFVTSATDECACISTCPISNCTECSDALGSCCRICAVGYTVSACRCTTTTPTRGGIQLTAGHISGIIVGVLLGLILLSVLIALLLIGYHIGYRKKSHDKPKPTTRIITITPAQQMTEHNLAYHKSSVSSDQGSDEETVSIDFHKND